MGYFYYINTRESRQKYSLDYYSLFYSQIIGTFGQIEHLHFPHTFSYFFNGYSITSLGNIHAITFWNHTKHSIKVSLEISTCSFKGATKLHFMHYLRVVIILLNTGLYKSAFSAYFFCKTRFSFFCFLSIHASISLVFSFYYFCSIF